MPLGPGTRLDGYEILRPLGSGGMGEVWLANEVRLGRKVALKVLPTESTRDLGRVQRFEQEARAASVLNHPNVCHIYALGAAADGQHYIAMEYVEGETLRQRLTRGRPPLGEALDIAIQIATALSAAHAAGVVHRDLKPENVMIRPDGVAKVLDFGLAKLAPLTGREGADSTHTVFRTDAGRVMGTVTYMSPEQARGVELDARTDIWSLGVILYEMVAAVHPFSGPTSSDVLAAILDRDPAPLMQVQPHMPGELDRIVTKALRKDRERRYQFMKELHLDLDALREETALREHTFSDATSLASSGSAASIAPTGGTVPISRANRRRTLVGGAAALAVLAFAAAGAWFWSTYRTRAPIVTPGPTARRLTANPAELSVTSAHISPDGKYVAYSDRTGIQVRVIDTGETQRLADTRGMTVYAWTGDSTKVRAARCDQHTCTGWDLSLLGGAQRPSGATWGSRQLSPAEWRPANQSMWASQDGLRLLSLDEHGDVKVDFLNGQEPKTVAHGADWSRGAGWSADDARVYFARGPGAIESVSADGSSPTPVFRTERGTEVINIGPAFGDDRIFAVLQKTIGSIGLQASARMLVEIHANGPDASHTRALTEWGPDLIDQISASSDASRFTFLRESSQLDIYVADFDAVRAVLPTPTRLTQDERDDFATAWTTDSTQAILWSDRNGTSDLFKQRPDSDVAEPFVVAPGDQTLARVTSDGRWVLYTDDQPDKPTRIMRVPLAGGRPEVLVTFPPGTSGWCQCAYHGRCVLVENRAARDSSSVVFALDPTRGRQQELTQFPAHNGGTALIADGEHFAYIVPEEKGIRNRIRIVSFQGEPPKDIVVKNAVRLLALDAFPTGGFLSTETASPHQGLVFIRADGNATLLWRPEHLDASAAIPSPDGKHLAMNVWTRQSNVWLIDQR
jgi:eukaryotic-like serine/threonine-protein kinase